MSSNFLRVVLFLLLASLPIFVSTETISVSSFLIDCGSVTNTTIDNRLFSADIKTPKSTFVLTNTSSSSDYYSQLYETSRVFNETTHYTFRIPNQGRHWIRLYFATFLTQNLTGEAKFSVTAQNRTLLRDYRSERLRTSSEPLLKEYSLNITSDTLVVTFAPFPSSLAFVSAIEVVPLPSYLVPETARVSGSRGALKSLSDETLETVLRVNMGNKSVSPDNDALRRSWVGDRRFLLSPKVIFVSDFDKVQFKSEGVLSENIAPREVYGTATRLDVGRDFIFANLTWHFDSLARGFEYFVRFYFCNIVIEDRDASATNSFFNVFVDSQLVSSHREQHELGVPYFLDSVVRLTGGGDSPVTISVGPVNFEESHRALLVNGLEISKLPDSKDRLEEVEEGLVRRKRPNRVIVFGFVVAGVLVCSVLVATLFLVLYRRRRQRRKLATVGNSKDVDVVVNAVNNPAGGTLSGGEIAYFYPLAVVREATDGFSESLVIGSGGFGKVYKGVLGESQTEVAIKRGVSNSSQGLAEFRTEIEMLSQFRHRHLVSMIGYCDERNELIIIYEYMHNLTLKEHLYGSGDFETLSWRQRVQICIGSAKGLHYLHTGTAKPIIHRDVKSANILLDENLMAKVADFGLSKAGPEIDKSHVSTVVKGSFGYLDPEYLVTQRLTEKSDVYSFGVVMLEVLCGRAVIDPSRPREEANLIDWATKRAKMGRFEEILDACLVGQVKPESVSKFWEVVDKCLAERGSLRPAMGDVLWNLECVLRLQGVEAEICSSPVIRTDDDLDHDRIEVDGISAVDLGDLADVSMSEVFAKMVKEDSRLK